MALHRAEGRDWGTNLARVKDYNEVVVLDLVRTSGPIGRAAIAAATGLTVQTVSNIARRLLAAGAVLEEPSSKAPRRTLRVNPDAGFALGIQLERAGIAVGVVDLAGTVRGGAEATFALGDPPERVLERLGGLVDEALAAAELDREQLLGAGIGASGPLELREGTLLNVLKTPEWTNFPMRAAASEALGLRVILDNDATAAAMGERWRGAAAGADHFVYVYLGTGLGTGLVLRGQPYRGARGNAGEISHISVDPAGPPCECGRRGCLGLYLSAAGLVREAQRVVLEAPPNDPLPERPETLEQLVASAEPRLQAVLARAGRLLGGALADLARILDPELIVLGGPLVPVIGEELRDAVAEELRPLGQPGAPAPHVELSHIGSDAGVIGAATLVLHDLYAPSATKLSLAAADARGETRRPAA